MKKKIVCLFLIALVVFLTVMAVVRINRHDENNELKKITVADATITSLTVAIA